MDSYEYNELLTKLKTKIANIEQIVDPERLHRRLEEIEASEREADFWSDAKKAAAIQKEKNRILSILKKYHTAKESVEDAAELFEMAKAEGDEESLNELFSDASHLEDLITKLEVEMMLSDENDAKNAIVTIHPGAGGRRARIGRVCSIVCICAGRNGWDTESKFSTISRARRRVSRM